MNAPFSIEQLRDQFPALHAQDNQDNVTYLDSAATTQLPQVVIDTLTTYYQHLNANVHRGSHRLTEHATIAYENARKIVQQFIHATSSDEIIWTRGTTEAINLIANTYGRHHLRPNDEILVSELEHHANLVPWQLIAEQTGAKVVKIPMTPECTLDMDAFYQRLSTRTKIVAVAHITNVTGTRNPIEELIAAAHNVGAIAVIDGAQAIAHENINVRTLDADFYVFSGHKMYSPAGIGVLYGKKALLDDLPPWHGGGKMVEHVSFEGTTFADVPARFEAGTPNVAGALGLASAIHWLQSQDHDAITRHIAQLRQKALEGLATIDDLRIIGLQPNSSVISFVIDGIHHQDIAMLLDQQNIAVRAGHHCAHPMLDALGLSGTVRLSLAAYNNRQDIETFINALRKACSLL